MKTNRTKFLLLIATLVMGAKSYALTETAIFTGHCRYENVHTGELLAQAFTLDIDANRKRVGIPVIRHHAHGLSSIIVSGFAEFTRAADGREAIRLGYTHHSGEPHMTLDGASSLEAPSAGNKLTFHQQFPYGKDLHCEGTVL